MTEAASSSTSAPESSPATTPAPPNVLLLLVDQMQYPPVGYGDHEGVLPLIRQILNFSEELDEDNPFIRFFPGFMRLRRHAVVMRNHMVAASACTPSRATIFTGQYSTLTGVSQTDGLFKSAESRHFPWLHEDGYATAGEWFRAAGYSTHYFGKWHVSNPATHSLEGYGFSDWELSYPEPHGQELVNLGLYRDIGFADLARTWLHRRGLGLGLDYLNMARAEWSTDPTQVTETKPWFTVVSFANPHDIATYPSLPRKASPDSQGKAAPVVVPLPGAKSAPPTPGTMRVALNPLGFPRENCGLPETIAEDLTSKPSCQYDYSYKIGLALGAKGGSVASSLAAGVPFQLNKLHSPEDWSRAFLQYYFYLQQVVDGHIHRVLSALDESGLADNTIIVFAADHGEYAVSHGMLIEKWHAAYEEMLHVPLVISGPLVNPDRQLRSETALSSHIDLLPTLLGLAGQHADALPGLMAALPARKKTALPVGADLSPVILGQTGVVTGPDGQPRQGVLFLTDDEITMPLTTEHDPFNAEDQQHYQDFLTAVDLVRAQQVPRLLAGAVTQPNHIQCVRTLEWKLARYWDPNGVEADQWEMYNLSLDPTERTNLLVFDGAFPTPNDQLPSGLAGIADQIVPMATELMALLNALVAAQATPQG